MGVIEILTNCVIMVALKVPRGSSLSGQTSKSTRKNYLLHFIRVNQEWVRGKY